MDKRSALIEWGLNEKEAKVYLCILECSPAPAQEISKETGILRQTVYEILNRLESLGLVAEVQENKKTHYISADPDNLLSRLDEKKEIVNSVLPDLKRMMRKRSSLSDARLFRGLKGIKSVNEEVLRSKEIFTILPIIGEERMKEFYIGNFSKRRIERKIPIKILRGALKTAIQKSIDSDEKSFRQVRIFKGLEDIKTQYILFGDSLAIVSFHEEPFGVVIKDDLVFDSMKTIFEFIWSVGKIH